MLLRLLIVVFLLGSPILARADKKCLILGAETPSEIMFKVASTVSAALTEAGICHKIKYWPGKRLIDAFQKKRIDGEIARISFYNDFINNVGVKVAVPVFEGTGYLIVKDRNIKSLFDMHGKTLGIIRGHVWQYRISQNHSDIIEVSNADQLPSMLEAGRISGFLIDNIWWERNRKNHPELRSYFMMDGSLYVWLLKENSAYIEPIQKALNDYQSKFGTFWPQADPQTN